MATIIIKPLRSSSEYKECISLQIRVWGFPPEYAIPDHFLKVTPEIGGVLLGAYEEDQLAGFLFAVPAFKGGGWSHLMHMIGVEPRQRDENVGLLLLLQYAEELKSLAPRVGLTGKVFWTYDPLEGRNASLYLRKVGGRAIRFMGNVYGDQPGQYQELPTDRFEILWEPLTEQTQTRLGGKAIPPTFESLADVPFITSMEGAIGEERIHTQEFDIQSPKLLVSAPADFQALKEKNLPLARDAQMQLGSIFKKLFEARFSAVNFLSEERNGIRRNAYLFEKGTAEERKGKQ